MKDKKKYDYILFTLPTCTKCPEIKDILKKSNLNYFIADCSTENGLNLAKELGAKITPTLYISDNKQLCDDIDEIKKILL